MNLLITGATGFLGKNLVTRLLDDAVYKKIYLLIRSSGTRTADQRLDDLISEVFPPAVHVAAREKFYAIEADLTKPKFGLDVSNYQNLALDIQQILHVGASTDFGAPLDISRKYNVYGTQEVLDLARVAMKSGSFFGLEYISTAFVAGIKKGLVSENELTRGQKFANNYEQSKWEAECIVQAASKEMPVTIYRPSIVVGDSRNGYTSHFKVLYWPLRLLSKNLIPFVPANYSTKLDVVPVDYVSDAILAYMKLLRKPKKVLHITSGTGNEVSVRKLLKDAQRLAGINRRPILPMFLFDMIRLSILSRLLSKEFWQTCQVAEPYYYYLKGTGVSFDAYASDKILSDIGVTKPKWEDYKEKVLTFCTSSRWGRKPLLPSFKYYQ